MWLEEAFIHVKSLRSHLFTLLITLRVIDFTQTAIGSRLGLQELNTLAGGLMSLILLNIILIACLLLITYISEKYLADLKVKYASDVLLIFYVSWSLYSTLWVNPLALSGS